MALYISILRKKMSCKWMISHALPMNNPTQMLACKSLNAAGKWAFLPCLNSASEME